MKRLAIAALAVIALGVAIAISQQVVPPADTINCAYNASPPAVSSGQMVRVQCDDSGRIITSGSGSTTNPTSVLTLTSATTAYSVANNIASNANGTLVVVPSFSIVNSAGAATICAMDLLSDDTTSTAWGGVTIQIDLWRAAPTFASGNGDRLAYLLATGSANYIASFAGTFAPFATDGTYGRLVPTTGDCVKSKLASGSSIFWTAQALTSSGVTGASKHFTLVPEVQN